MDSEKISNDESGKKPFSRRSFLKTGAIVAGVGAAGVLGLSSVASAKSSAYGTLIDLTKCDGCKNEPAFLPRQYA